MDLVAVNPHNRVVRVLGIDYGARRIGLALSDPTATLASPWRLIERPASERATLALLVGEIEALAGEDDGLAAVVIGWPRRLDGTPTHQTPLVEALARAPLAGLCAAVDVKFLEPVYPGERLDYLVRLARADEAVWRFEVEAEVERAPVARGVYVVARLPGTELNSEV